MRPETPQFDGQSEAPSALEQAAAAHRESDSAYKDSMKWTSKASIKDQDALWRKNAEAEMNLNQIARGTGTDSLVDHMLRDPGTGRNNISNPVLHELFYRGRTLSDKHLSSLALHHDPLVSHLAATHHTASPETKVLHALTHPVFSCRYCQDDKEY